MKFLTFSMKALQLLLVLQCLLVGRAVSQTSSITSGAGEPKQHWPWYDFYLDTRNHRAYVHHPGMHGDPWWREIDDHETLTLDACNGLSICFDGKNYRAYLNAYRLRGIEFTDYHCLDKLLLAWNQYEVVTYNASGDVSEELFGNCLLGIPIVDTLGGKLAFCVVAAVLNENAYPCEEMTAWGMMGLDGHWLIEPKFDAPFYFQDGFAEVIYYGEKRRINLKGEFVN